jgi:hypothetical protein
MELIYFYIIGAYVLCGGYFAPQAIEKAQNLNQFIWFIVLTLVAPISILLGLVIILKQNKLSFFDNY